MNKQNEKETHWQIQRTNGWLPEYKGVGGQAEKGKGIKRYLDREQTDSHERGVGGRVKKKGIKKTTTSKNLIDTDNIY